MAKTLVVVESPTKAKTLERYLGQEFTVRASYGHIRDLPKNKLGVDTEHEFEPEYVIPEASKKAVASLQAAHKRADDVFLATDFDREGEAIAWHVAESRRRRGAANRVDLHRDHQGRGPGGVRSIPARSTCSSSTRSRPAASSTGWSATGCRRCCGRRSGRGLSAGRVQSVAAPADRRPRARDPRRSSPSSTGRRRAPARPDGRRRTPVPRPADPDRRRQARRARRDKKGLVLGTRRTAPAHVERPPPAPTTASRRSSRREVKRNAGAAVHHLHAAAGGRAQARLLRAARRCRSRSSSTRASTCRARARSASSPTCGPTRSTSPTRRCSEIAGAHHSRSTARSTRSAQPRLYKKKQRGAQEAHEAIRPTAADARPRSELEPSSTATRPGSTA